MSDEQQRLQQEITQLQGAITALANLPDAQKPLQAQLDAKRRDLAKLTGASTPAAGNQTTIHGDVTGNVMSGSFSGPVTLGPQIQQWDCHWAWSPKHRSYYQHSWRRLRRRQY